MSVMICEKCGCPVDTDFDDHCAICGGDPWPDEEDDEFEEEDNEDVRSSGVREE